MMGARGPQPTPSAIKQARGTYRADRAARNEAAPIGTPKLPTWIKDKDARAEFKRVVKVLSAMGLVGSADGNLISRYALAWVRWRRIVQTLAANPGTEFQTYRDESGNVKSVQVSALNVVARGLAEELSRAEAALGMSPSARSRIEVQMPPASAAAPKSRFFDPPLKIAT